MEYGCAEKRAVRCGDWIVWAVELRNYQGCSAGWDVNATHVTGNNLFAGENFHRDPTKEVARLVELIDWPSA